MTNFAVRKSFDQCRGNCNGISSSTFSCRLPPLQPFANFANLYFFLFSFFPRCFSSFFYIWQLFPAVFQPYSFVLTYFFLYLLFYTSNFICMTFLPYLPTFAIKICNSKKFFSTLWGTSCNHQLHLSESFVY